MDELLRSDAPFVADTSAWWCAATPTFDRLAEVLTFESVPVPGP